MAKKRMSKSRRQHLNRVKKLAVFSGLTALLLATSTYAWFTGLQAINVTPFEVEIAVADGLQLLSTMYFFSCLLSLSFLFPFQC